MFVQDLHRQYVLQISEQTDTFEFCMTEVRPMCTRVGFYSYWSKFPHISLASLSVLLLCRTLVQGSIQEVYMVLKGKIRHFQSRRRSRRAVFDNRQLEQTITVDDRELSSMRTEVSERGHPSRLRAVCNPATKRQVRLTYL